MAERYIPRKVAEMKIGQSYWAQYESVRKYEERLHIKILTELY